MHCAYAYLKISGYAVNARERVHLSRIIGRFQLFWESVRSGTGRGHLVLVRGTRVNPVPC